MLFRSVDGGHGGDTQVKAVAPDGEHGVAVLGHLVLGNIHAAHDLQAGDDEAQETARTESFCAQTWHVIRQS